MEELDPLDFFKSELVLSENAMEFARVERSFDMMKLLQPYTEEQEEDEDEEGHGEL